jgi:hypothetical protein
MTFVISERRSEMSTLVRMNATPDCDRALRTGGWTRRLFQSEVSGSRADSGAAGREHRKVTGRVAPVYSELAKKMNVAGTVRLIAIVAPERSWWKSGSSLRNRPAALLFDYAVLGVIQPRILQKLSARETAYIGAICLPAVVDGHPFEDGS